MKYDAMRFLTNQYLPIWLDSAYGYEEQELQIEDVSKEKVEAIRGKIEYYRNRAQLEVEEFLGNKNNESFEVVIWKPDESAVEMLKKHVECSERRNFGFSLTRLQTGITKDGLRKIVSNPISDGRIIRVENTKLNKNVYGYSGIINGEAYVFGSSKLYELCRIGNNNCRFVSHIYSENNTSELKPIFIGYGPDSIEFKADDSVEVNFYETIYDADKRIHIEADKAVLDKDGNLVSMVCGSTKPITVEKPSLVEQICSLPKRVAQLYSKDKNVEQISF